jgi:hypothetical protein
VTPSTFLLLRSENKLNINSGDEYAYEYVTHERAYFVDTFDQKGMLVLPPNPMSGMKIVVSDYYGSWQAHPLIVHRNGQKIMGIEENMECDEPFSIFAMTFAPETGLGWVVHQNVQASETNKTSGDAV